MIAVEDIEVAIRGRRLLDGIRLELRPGRIVALLGPNGAGKSTLLRVLAGDLRPSGGIVKIDGRPLSAWSRMEQARRRAVMLQDSYLPFAFSAEEVTLLGRAPHAARSSARRDRDIARAALARVDAGELASRTYPTLSGGEKQRVQMARALAQIWEDADGGRHLLLDEPTASLDPLHQHIVLRQLRAFAAEGVGALVILHDLNLAAQYADEVVLLRAGAMVARGSIDATLTEANLATAFGLEMGVVRHPDMPCPLIYSGGKRHGASQPESH